MGYMRHHAIVVTSWDSEPLERVRAKAVELDMSVTATTDSAQNGYRSFMVAPDGSKEGWPEDQQGNERRDALIEFIRSLAYGDGSSSIAWAEVQYGDDDRESYIVRSGDQDYAARGYAP